MSSCSYYSLHFSSLYSTFLCSSFLSFSSLSPLLSFLLYIYIKTYCITSPLISYLYSFFFFSPLFFASSLFSSILRYSPHYYVYRQLLPSLFSSSVCYLTSFSSFVLLSLLLPCRVGFSDENRNPLIVMGLRTLTRHHIPGTYTTLHYTTLHYTFYRTVQLNSFSTQHTCLFVHLLPSPLYCLSSYYFILI